MASKGEVSVAMRYVSSIKNHPLHPTTPNNEGGSEARGSQNGPHHC